jgi:hypothetical protein
VFHLYEKSAGKTGDSELGIFGNFGISEFWTEALIKRSTHSILGFTQAPHLAKEKTKNSRYVFIYI